MIGRITAVVLCLVALAFVATRPEMALRASSPPGLAVVDQQPVVAIAPAVAPVGWTPWDAGPARRALPLNVPRVWRPEGQPLKPWQAWNSARG